MATPLVMPMIALQALFMLLLRARYIGFYLQNPVSEQLALGMSQADTVTHLITVYGFLIVVFLANALCFVPLGHLASRLMMRQDSLVAYSWNLIGSLVGILVFTLLSFMKTPPSIWMLLTVLWLMLFLREHISSLLPTAVAAAVLLGVLGIQRATDIDLFSPYQVLTLHITRGEPPLLGVNNVYYQRLLDLSGAGRADSVATTHYSLPYLFKPHPEEVLIVGSGTGNDVAAAVRHGAKRIEAVEIDPSILRYGAVLHPESPYQASNVVAVVDDARAFIRYTPRKYDLITYGLLDSHALLSGLSAVRLDSFVYTVQAFREARAKLKADGVIVMSFCIMRPELGRKLFLMLQDAFDGRPPWVFQTEYDGAWTFATGDRLEKGLVHAAGLGLTELTDFSNPAIIADKSTDDWPFLYMPQRKYPLSYVVMILTLLILSLVVIRQMVPAASGGFSAAAFFLGAGFMLVEVKGITELALVYGSTWMVVAAVSAFILALAFLANLLVLFWRNLPAWLSYGLLAGCLVAGLCVSSDTLTALRPVQARLVMTALLTLPLFFSGLAFSAELRKCNSVAVALSSNLMGAMLGGFLEYNSMYFGFRSLYVVALVMYLLAFLGTSPISKNASRAGESS
ncbi:MAG: hypothetical protein V1873_03400 [Verrucomicrobiota bacterium]